ncbi:transposase [Mariniblastus sp.]|nr:transposase [Mariniblastus sp.]
MVCSGTKLAVYRPRRPRASPLYRTIERYLPAFERCYDQRYANRYGPWRPIIGDVARRLLRCGDLHFGFARIQCADCHHEMFVAFSCQQRCLCSSCHQKRTILVAETIAHTICAPVPHRQLVFTIPKRLRIYCRYDRRLLGGLARAAWRATVEVYRQELKRGELIPGMVAGIQTFGELVHFHPHIHAIVTDGGFTPGGTFICLPRIETKRLLAAWQNNVFALFLAENKIDQKTVDQMRSWPHSGFSVDNSVYLSPNDSAGLERLAQYILRCPFSLARVVRLTNDGSVVYRAQQDRCRRFPGPASGDLKNGPRRNFQVFSALDFLAEVTQHIPNKGEHLVRYYGWYSHRQRGMRAKAGSDPKKIPVDRAAIYVDESSDRSPRKGSVSTWARLIKRVYEVDPLECPECGGAMKIISFIERRQTDVIQRILRHCGLWQGFLRTHASPRAPPNAASPKPTAPREFVLVPDGELLEAQSGETQAEDFREFQLVLDPEFL